MPVTSYISVGGRMISEVTDGVILDYVPDALGSIHSVIDQDANVVKTMRYKPYGEVLSRSGTVADRHYQWVGTYGYRATFAPSSSHYVRARHYTATAGSWSTVDPLWPRESAYGYVNGRAVLTKDLSGLGTGDACKDNYDACLKRVDTKQNACFKRVMDAFAKDVKFCDKQSALIRPICLITANNVMVAGVAACSAKSAPQYALCGAQYLACREGQNAGRVLTCLTIAAGVTYCVYRVCKCVVGVAGAPETGGCSLVLVITP